MKKMNRRTKVVVMTVVMVVLFIAIYLCGLLIPDEAVAGSFLNT